MPFGKPVIAVEGTHWTGGVVPNCADVFKTLSNTSMHIFGKNNEAMDVYYACNTPWDRLYLPSDSSHQGQLQSMPRVSPSPIKVCCVFEKVALENHFNIMLNVTLLQHRLEELEALRCLGTRKCTSRIFVVLDLIREFPTFQSHQTRA